MDRTILVLLGTLTGIASPVRSRAQDTVVATSPTILAFSGQAQRFLALQYRAFATEFMGCLLGEVRGDTVLIERIAPADVDPAQSTAARVMPQQTCEAAGWGSTLGLIHGHPTGERCWYFFPGTSVPTSDGYSFLLGSYSVDAIMCGDRVVWRPQSAATRDHAFGNAGGDANHSPDLGRSLT